MSIGGDARPGQESQTYGILRVWFKSDKGHNGGVG